MNEKVQVTPKQAKGLSCIRDRELAIEKYFNDLNMGYDLGDLSLNELIKALYIGYEIKKEFKVGDWVVNTISNYGGIVRKAGRKILEVEMTYGKEFVLWGEKFTRHATPQEITEEKQRRWWAKHGREVWELRKGDVLKSENTRLIYGIADVKDSSILFVNESKFKTKNMIKRFYKVLCFAEQRLDTEGNNYDG